MRIRLAHWVLALHGGDVTRDLTADPAWEESDLGQPLPDSPHACSVALPTWSSVIGYEEKRQKVIKKMRMGYPRFYLHPLVERVFEMARKEVAGEGEDVVVFPTRASVLKAHRWVELQSQVAVRISSFHGLQALIVPAKAKENADLYWRFSGEILSSRQAQDYLDGQLKSGSKSALVSRAMAKFVQAPAEDIFVFSSGMAAMTSVLRALPGVAEGRKTLQLEFPYVDCLKVQEHFGPGVVYLNEAQGESFDEALMRIRQGEFAAVFTEVPSNPLLRTVDLKRVAQACREGGTPFVIDDSATGPYNIDALKFADVVTSSLTKWVSGEGDVMAGMAAVNPNSPFHDHLRPLLAQDSAELSPLYVADAQVLLSNLKGYAKRMKAVNANAVALAQWLSEHPAVEQVWHPSIHHREHYDMVMREEGAYGGLLSFVLKSPKKTPKVYDALRCCKGPSFGTRFTLVCPYVLLAHYFETEWTEACGVPTNLLRVSVGTESKDQVIGIFKQAFEEALG